MAFHLLTPQMAGVLDRVRRAAPAPFHFMTVEQARRAYIERSEVLELPRETLPRLDDLTVPGADGRPLRARLYAPRAAADGEPLPLLLYLHGGGFVIGAIETHDSLCRRLARLGDCAVLAVEYRLAPEHRFPTAVDDTWAVLRGLADGGAAALGLDATRLAVGGDSAGGTLSAVAALMARDAGLTLRAQVLITPGTGADRNFPSHRLFAQGFLLEAAGIGWFFDHYIDDVDRRDWRFAPLEAPDVDGVAPALVMLAECDPLVDEGLAYADRLRAAGVPTSLELYRGLTHDFIKMGRAIPEAAIAQTRIGEALRQAWAQPDVTL
jgi:acetyl esterase